MITQIITFLSTHGLTANQIKMCRCKFISSHIATIKAAGKRKTVLVVQISPGVPCKPNFLILSRCIFPHIDPTTSNQIFYLSVFCISHIKVANQDRVVALLRKYLHDRLTHQFPGGSSFLCMGKMVRAYSNTCSVR